MRTRPRTDDRKRKRKRKRKPRRRPDAAQRRRVDELAQVSLILGLVALLACGLIAPFAIIKANEAKRLAAKLRLPPPAYATGGLALGWLSLAGLLFGLLYVVLVFTVLLG